jgi:alpha-L-fucosidase
MSFSRRELLKWMGCAVPAITLGGRMMGQGLSLPKSTGAFHPTRESLSAYEVPRWFRDAKFGIWAHWGPQSAIEDGDWYARNMYIQGQPQYQYHLEHYGHPSKFGYKDTIRDWKAAKWDPEHLMSLYRKAGAKYFVSMGVHHDNFDLWNSKYQRWNSVNMGPKKDIVGLWRKAAMKEGLPFGVSEHLWITYKWFAVSHGSDQTGPLAGVPYDGADPKYADLYLDTGCLPFSKNSDSGKWWNDNGIPESWRRHYLARITDLIDKYEPDLLYTDGHLPFDEVGMTMVSHLYNVSARRHGGVNQAVYNSKDFRDCAIGTCVQDHERGVSDVIAPNPWQTDTCIGEWHYRRGARYKSAKKVIDLLVDIVSKNGNLLLNFPLPNSGELDAEEMKVLEGITSWMTVNGEGIYGTRPWLIAGDGPSMKASTNADAMFNEGRKPNLTAADIRFTTKGYTLFAFVMGWPEKEVLIAPLGSESRQKPGKIENVTLLGYDGKLTWKQEANGLRVQMPASPISDIAVALKVQLS